MGKKRNYTKIRKSTEKWLHKGGYSNNQIASKIWKCAQPYYSSEKHILKLQ